MNSLLDSHRDALGGDQQRRQAPGNISGLRLDLFGLLRGWPDRSSKRSHPAA
jgi:hypothetical protein